MTMSMAGSSSCLLWRQCSDWLIRCGILDRTHRITNDSSDISDFAHILRDGVLLCQVANRLKRGSVDMREMALRPQLSQFLCLKNICLFLRACSNTFGLAPSDLFEAWELYKVSDFGKILLTLSKLSHTPAALECGVSGFPERSGSEHEYYNDDIYRSLAEEADSRELNKEVQYTAPVSDEEEYGKIYDVIISRSAEATKGTVTTPVQQFDELIPKDKRGHCIKEMLDTEQNYVEALNMLLKKFYTPLRSILTTEDHSIVFMNLSELCRLHQTFLTDLRQAVRVSVSDLHTNGPSHKRIGDIFVYWKLQFVKYSEFCSKLPCSQSRIDQLCADNSAVRQKIIECQADANQNRFRLQDLLSVPMQRVLKYPLLLKELVKLTSADNADSKSLVHALEAMKDISSFINEVKRDSELQTVIRDIEVSIDHLTMPENTTLCDYGRLLKDGELKMCSHDQDKSRIRLRYVFIFDKVMMICKPSRANQHTYKDAIVLIDYQLEDSTVPEPGSNRTFNIIRSGQKWSFGWCLIHKEGRNVIQMYAQSLEQKESWMSAIQSAHENVRPESADNVEHIFVYATFDRPEECTACQELLKGLFYQGYRCQKRGCNAKAHKECITRCGPCEPRYRPTSFSQPEQIVGLQMRADRSFCDSNVPEALAFREDDIIEVVSNQTRLEGWWKGRLLDSSGVPGTEGLFPAEYVRRIRKPKPKVNRRHTDQPIQRTCIPDRGSSTSTITTMEERRLSMSSTASRSPSSPSLDSTPPEGACSNPTLARNEYKNLDDLSCYKWSGGNVERLKAEEVLQGMATGTFMVRFSDKQHQYVISLTFNREVKHVKIEQNASGYWLDEGQIFPSIVELVQYYEKHNMCESFQALDTTLRVPIKEAILGVAKAMHDFEATANNMLSLKKGDKVVILSKNGDERGWWKGKVDSRIGYFPLAFVSEVGDHHSVSALLSSINLNGT